MEPGLLLSTVLLTVLLSAAAAGVSTYYLNRSKETLSFFGQKREELYSQVESLDYELSKFFERNYCLTGDAPQEIDHQGVRHASKHIANVKMIVNFYFPLFSHALARVMAATETAHRALSAAQQSKTDRDPLFIAVDATVCELKDALEDMKAAILKDGPATRATTLAAHLWRRPKSIPASRRILQVADAQLARWR